MRKLTAITLLTVLFFLSACNNKPEPIKYGKDNCHYCKMTITDTRYGAEIVTNKGKIYKFDEISCLLNFINEEEIEDAKIKGIYISDFCGNNLLIDKNQAFFMQSDSLKSPMGGNIASFSNNDSSKIYSEKMSGKIFSWSEVVKYSLEE
ncbi:MAG: nitrous oxide reductase accessory protein NosL [Bacteroidetes bacterium]|nr:nitrous oxide reductase accessory protein NosL [Bacteroidota bacterium]